MRYPLFLMIATIVFNLYSQEFCNGIEATTTTNAVVGQTQSKNSVATKEKKTHRAAQEQQHTRNYLARLKFLLDGACSGQNPILRITCENNGALEILRLGHSSLVCDTSTASNTAVCYSTCSNRAECSGVYFTTAIDDDTYAEIYFQCSGEETIDTLSNIITEPTPVSSNGFQCSDGLFNTRFFYVVQLGVFCAEFGTEGEYSYSSKLFECTNQAYVLDEKYSNGNYACFAGNNCDGYSCSDAAIRQTGVRAERTFDTCSDFGENDAAVVGKDFTAPEGDYTIRYQARWSLGVDTYRCEALTPEVVMRCIGGGSISLVEFDETGLECNVTDTNTIKCDDTCGSCRHFIYPRISSGVVFECSANNLDDARSEATYISSGGSCASVASELVSHHIQLGLYCGSAVLGGDFSFHDYYVECGGNWHNQENGEDSFFECGTSIQVGDGNWTLPDVDVYMEPFDQGKWSSMLDNNCITATNLATTISPTPAPVTISISHGLGEIFSSLGTNEEEKEEEEEEVPSFVTSPVATPTTTSPVSSLVADSTSSTTSSSNENSPVATNVASTPGASNNDSPVVFAITPSNTGGSLPVFFDSSASSPSYAVIASFASPMIWTSATVAFTAIMNL